MDLTPRMVPCRFNGRVPFSSLAVYQSRPGKTHVIKPRQKCSSSLRPFFNAASVLRAATRLLSLCRCSLDQFITRLAVSSVFACRGNRFVARSTLRSCVRNVVYNAAQKYPNACLFIAICNLITKLLYTKMINDDFTFNYDSLRLYIMKRYRVPITIQAFPTISRNAIFIRTKRQKI